MAGGDSNCNCGTIFKVDQAGKEMVLYRFQGAADGSVPPFGYLLWNNKGDLYTTNAAGANADGTLFKLTP